MADIYDSDEDSEDLSDDFLEIKANVTKRSRKIGRKVIFDSVKAVINAAIPPDPELQVSLVLYLNWGLSSLK